MMGINKNILVFIPNTLTRNEAGFLRGCYRKFGDCHGFYITNDVVSNTYKQSVGYLGSSFKNFKISEDNYLFINNVDDKILLNNSHNHGRYSIIEIIYDYYSFKNSDTICEESDSYGKHFRFLADEVKKSSTKHVKENGRRNLLALPVLVIICFLDVIAKILSVVKPVLQCSATLLHFEKNILNVRWFLQEILQKRKLSPKIGNMIVAKAIDLIIGIVLLNWCLKYETKILNFFQTAVEDIITNLKGLLLYLMGSPIGLKLNHSFNNTLGKFFFYHISLWRVFLQGTEPLLRVYFRYLVLPGALGFSFQIAMFSDIISIATFHVYCIYVYAARLFLLQIRGLASLWRLFIGRKLNPLRERVDSCKYSPDQLFIGTLGFTILLFLLPTTAMYYAVFTTFRLMILFANGLLLRAIFLLNTLPLYALVLWIFNSSSVAGTAYINWKNEEDSERTVVEAKLKPLPLKSCIKSFVPDPVKSVEGKSYGYILSSMFTGVLL